MHQVRLDQLRNREDFYLILGAKFPSATSLEWVGAYLLRSVDFLEQCLQRLRGKMLDSKAFSAKQLFRLFERVDELISENVD